MTGSDWRYYELDYNKYSNGEISFENLLSFYGNYDIGYYVIAYIISNIGINFWYFFMSLKLILFFINFNFLWKVMNKENFNVTFVVYYCYFAVFLFVDNPARNLIAATFFLIAINYLIDRRFFYYFLITVIASVFHNSLLVLIPLYFLLNKKYSKKTHVFFFIFYNIVYVLFSENIILISQGLEFVLNYVNTEKFDQQINAYLINNDVKDRPLSIGNVTRYLMFVLLILRKNSIENKYKNGFLFFNIAMFSLFILRTTFLFSIIYRLIIPTSLIYVIIVSNIHIYYNNMYRTVVKYFIIITHLGFLYFQITVDYKYLPYSNYILYLFQEKPSYEYRFNYNLQNSPYIKRDVYAD